MNGTYSMAKSNVCCALLAFLLVFGGTASAGGLVTKASPKHCVQGLYSQPPGGPFSVFLFCDDAQGINIGVVNTSAGAGPGAITLAPPMEWDKWDVNNRFWQEPDWATDITSFAWTADLRYLYVATSYVYGTDGLYKLDLVKRSYTKLLPLKAPSKYAKLFVITGIDKQSGTVTVNSTYFDPVAKKTETKTVEIK
jgi:hypothetical protein